MRAPTVLGAVLCAIGMAVSPTVADTIPAAAVPVVRADSTATEGAKPAPPPISATAGTDSSATTAAAASVDTARNSVAGADSAKPATDTGSHPPPKQFPPPMQPAMMRGPHGVMPPPEAHGAPPPPAAVETPSVDVTEIDTMDEEKALEIKLKTDPEAARRYRSPRKAFFLSLIIPGAGQAYCGSWGKAAFFATTEISLGVGWYYVVVIKAREKEHQAQRYAAAHWKMQKYDSTWNSLYGTDTLTEIRQSTASNRESWCEALYGNTSSNLYSACVDGPKNSVYNTYTSQFTTGATNATAGDSVQSFWNNNIVNMTTFYNLIGYSEFSSGWEDNSTQVTDAQLQAYYKVATDNDPSTVASASGLWGTSAMQQHYLALRSRADQLARMQKWFMGGMIINHLAAAFDAALQAGRMNRELLQLQTSWLDGLDFQGGMAWSGGLPGLQGRLAWSF